MKAFVTSIGEPTTELCVWSLERNGFDVELITGGGLLVDKLKTIYEKAEEDFVRIDADVVVNKSFTPEFAFAEMLPETWWQQYICFDWLKLNLSYGGVQAICKEAIPFLRKAVDNFHHEDRPETALSRIPEFYNPRRFDSCQAVVGLHGYALGEHFERVRYQKHKRKKYYHEFDFELMAKLEELLK